MFAVNSSFSKKIISILPALGAVFCLTIGSAIAQDQGDPLDWVYGPATCRLGKVAQIEIPEGYQFVGGDGTRMLMEWMENPTNGRELGFVMPEVEEEGGVDWFVVFEYDPIGYVSDDEKDELDADALIEGMIEGTEEANKTRRQNGWEEFHVRGWRIPPYYDMETNNLKWAIIGYGDSGETVNFSTRLLGRGGAMSADLVIDPESLDGSLPDYDSLMSGFSFSTGNRYAEFREGDKIAKYGLTALIAGGAGAAAMKTGLLARFWKFIVMGFLALMGFFRKLFGRLFGRSE
jgi:uncharacterized membrane-anchored protein